MLFLLSFFFFAWLFTTKWQNEKVRSLRKAFVRSVFPELTGNLGDDAAQRVTFVGDFAEHVISQYFCPY